MTATTTRTVPSESRVAAPGSVALLTVWVEAVALFGLATLLVPWVRNEMFNWVAFGNSAERFEPAAREFMEFAWCLTGALTVAMAVGMWFVVRTPLRRGEPWAWHAVVATIGSWFVLDSTASIATGFGRNAVLNVVLVAAAVPGLLASRPG